MPGMAKMPLQIALSTLPTVGLNAEWFLIDDYVFIWWESLILLFDVIVNCCLCGIDEEMGICGLYEVGTIFFVPVINMSVKI